MKKSVKVKIWDDPEKGLMMTEEDQSKVYNMLVNENPTDCTSFEPFKVYVENVTSFENILKLFKDSDITDIEIRTHSNILFSLPPETLELYLNNFKITITTIIRNEAPTLNINNDVIIKINKD